jgi:hypothetical protein
MAFLNDYRETYPGSSRLPYTLVPSHADWPKLGVGKDISMMLIWTLNG